MSKKKSTFQSTRYETQANILMVKASKLCKLDTEKGASPCISHSEPLSQFS